MSSIDPGTVISHADGAISREINGEVVLLTPENSTVHVLDEVGSRIWELCSGSASVDTIVDGIIAEYEVSRDTAEQDVIEFCDKLLDLGVIRAD